MAQNPNERLASDYREMLKIQNRPYLKWIAVKGEPPYVREYLLFTKVRSYALSTAAGGYTVGVIRSCTIKVTLWDSYPYIAPHIRMLNLPPVFHPDWYSKGDYCSSQPWQPSCSLKDHVLRMIGTLMYEPSLMDTASPANPKALEWYLKNRDNDRLFPCDTVVLSENTELEVTALEKAAGTFDEIIDTLR